MMEILGQLPSIIQQLKSAKAIDQNFMINGCIHIGAHAGQEYVLYKAMNIRNLLFYEPIKKNFDTLAATVDNSVIIRNVALGNTKGEIEMYCEERGLSNSILEPAHHLAQYPQIEFPNKEIVEISTLDSETIQSFLYNMIVMDVQGYELEVLRGGEETLKHIDMVLTEINKVEMYKGCALVEDMDEYLGERGFHRICTYWQADGGTWGDGLYARINSK